MRAAIYLRGAPGDAAYLEQGSAVDLVKSRRWTLVTTFADPARRDPNLKRRVGVERLMRAAVARNLDVLVVSSSSRLFNTLHELVVLLAFLRAHDVHFVSAAERALDTTLPGNTLDELVATFAEFERVQHLAKLKLGIENARRAGVRIGAAAHRRRRGPELVTAEP